MINNDLSKVLRGKISRYSLVTATAKRARMIAEQADEDGIIITEKPVSTAINEIIEGKYKIIEPEEIRNI
ncbi:MAG: DNA-directed RNA polymerase subunit omega [Clostridiales bacterium]|jgi:DNA-directed RNA polymerase subunit omega|nr:DNA-directed RNA polymerase subunit omega [Clostridiales bacterium]